MDVANAILGIILGLWVMFTMMNLPHQTIDGIDITVTALAVATIITGVATLLGS